MDPLSVIVPTHNRPQKLLKVLRALETQTLDRHAFEIVVVDDGSTADTAAAVAGFRQASSSAVRFFRQPQRGPAAARNAGIRAAAGRLLVFIGDDTVPRDDFLQQHLKAHRQHRDDRNVAVVGYTTWLAGLRVTPFMKYIGECGPQFGFARMSPNRPLPYCFFYSSNLSLPRAMVQGPAHVFDEEFSSAAWEDIELGYRLQQNGMKLFYHPDAVARHDHATTIPAFCRRQLVVGRDSRILLKKHPELDGDRRKAGRMRALARVAPLAGIGETIGDFVDRRLGLPLPTLFYRAVLGLRYAAGASAASRSLIAER